MYSHVLALYSSLRTFLTITVCLALLPLTDISLLLHGQSQGLSQRAGHARRDKPEGALPDVEEVKGESQQERQTAPPIPSTVRSPKLPLKPWNGRRVGDPETRIDLDRDRGSRNGQLSPTSLQACHILSKAIVSAGMIIQGQPYGRQTTIDSRTIS